MSQPEGQMEITIKVSNSKPKEMLLSNFMDICHSFQHLPLTIYIWKWSHPFRDDFIRHKESHEEFSHNLVPQICPSFKRNLKFSNRLMLGVKCLINIQQRSNPFYFISNIILVLYWISNLTYGFYLGKYIFSICLGKNNILFVLLGVLLFNLKQVIYM